MDKIFVFINLYKKIIYKIYINFKYIKLSKIIF